MKEFEPPQASATRLRILRGSARDAVMLARPGTASADPVIEEAFKALDSNVRATLPQLIQRALRPITDLGDPHVAQAAAEALRSRQLLRFEPVISWDPATNTAPETIFEKHLANELQSAADTQRWATAIPIWSGLRGGAGEKTDTKANVDIGYTVAAGHFVLCELKIDSDDPVYAIAELATYILGYLVVRKLVNFVSEDTSERIRHRSHELLDARSVDWCVVAPESFYEKGIARSGGKRLTLAQLDQIRACAERHFRAAVHALSIEEHDLTISLRSFACAPPPPKSEGVGAKSRWISELRERTPLRKLIQTARQRRDAGSKSVV